MGIAALGKHLDCQCPDCQFPFVCDLEQANERKFLVCPNCGFDKIERAECPSKDAETVEIQLGSKKINRWDVVAFKIPGSSDAGIKRVVGLPTESVSINDGNILVGGKLCRKSIAHQKAMRIHVHDSKYSSTRDQPWSPHPGSAAWQFDSDTFRYSPLKNETGLEWITYKSRRHYANQSDQPNEIVPIEDSYGFNQSISRNLNPTDELYLMIDAEVAPESQIAIRFDHRSTTYELQINATKRQLKLTSSGRDLESIKLGQNALANPELQIEFSSIDSQLILLINGELVLQKNLPPTSGPMSTQPLAIGAGGGSVILNRVRIWRDIYYFGGSEEQNGLLDPTGPRKGFLLLGDNVPISIDSRHWKPASISAEDIIGRVKIDGIR